MIRIPMSIYMETLTINEVCNERPRVRNDARTKIEALTGYPYPLISLSVSQGKFSIESRTEVMASDK